MVLSQPDGRRVLTNLQSASGIGLTSGKPYAATDAFQFPKQPFGVFFEDTALFRLSPDPPPIKGAAVSLPIVLSLELTATGELVSAQAFVEE
ncbi:hypothetical protein [Actinokineospora sp.]|uniref:hypothetical protein n=1 Tax=Actinokineospora sp. TaxID=1872133 RepID=UPI003D6BC271